MISDVKNPDPATTASSMQFWKYLADVKNISNMYPYGKSYGTNAIYNKTDDYRYGFNGMEKERFPSLSVAKEGWITPKTRDGVLN